MFLSQKNQLSDDETIKAENSRSIKVNIEDQVSINDQLKELKDIQQQQSARPLNVIKQDKISSLSIDSLSYPSQEVKQQIQIPQYLSPIQQIQAVKQASRIPIQSVSPNRLVQQNTQSNSQPAFILTKDPAIIKEFDNIVRSDFSRFMKHRKCLNLSNLYLIYIFYFLQSSGILITTLSVSLFQKQFVWIGVFLNTCASLIHIYQQVNNKIGYKLQTELVAILQNRYICECQLVDAPADLQVKQQTKEV